MPSLKASKTHQNLKEAFATDSQANRRYLYFAKVADAEGKPETRRCSATSRNTRQVARTAISTT